MRHIIVAYDGTEPAKRALERAAEVAKAFDAKVTVTSIAPLLHSSPRADTFIERDSLAGHEAELTEATAFFSERGIDAESVSLSGDPASAIVTLAEQRQADLVVVGTREAKVAERFVHHSVSQQVARKVHCDLLIVHPQH